MKLFLMSVLLVGVPVWLSEAVASPGDEAEVVTAQIVVVVDGEAGSAKAPCIIKTKIIGDGDEPYVFTTSGDGLHFVSEDGHGTAVYTVAIGEDGDKAHGGSRMVWVTREDDGKKRGWLGVSIGNVPEALAAQLDFDGDGILVLNVVEGSPADRAGLQAHDVILSVDGDAVEGKLGHAVDLIKSREPGDEVEIVVLRAGREQSITVELGSRADAKGTKFEWKFPGSPHADVEESIHTYGKILRKGDNDEWIMEDLGDLEALKDLPANIQMLLPKSGSRSIQVFLRNDDKRIKTTVQRDGNTIAISQEGDGPITVERVDEDGQETTAEYENADLLRDDDEEAFELWENAGRSVTIHLNLDGLGENLEQLGENLEDLNFGFNFDLEAFKDHADEWKEHMEEWGKEWKEHIETAVEAGSSGLPMFFGKDGRSEHPRFMAMRHLGKPKHTFEVQTDGTIEVRIRKGGSELVQIFEDADDLARRSPKLYDKYENLMSAEEDE